MTDIEGFAFSPPNFILKLKSKHFLSSVVCCVAVCWQFSLSFCLYGHFRHNLGLLVFLRLVHLTAEQQRTCEVNQGILILRETTTNNKKTTLTHIQIKSEQNEM